MIIAWAFYGKDCVLLNIATYAAIVDKLKVSCSSGDVSEQLLLRVLVLKLILIPKLNRKIPERGMDRYSDLRGAFESQDFY